MVESRSCAASTVSNLSVRRTGDARRAQRSDARILRHNLKCNIVRTSHYPQSRHFLDACDEMGLLVLEEIPGWQHIGDEPWKQISIDNVGRMIRRDWNHPSIILWGVRINESRTITISTSAPMPWPPPRSYPATAAFAISNHPNFWKTSSP